ncbi:MAG: ABC transporter substrate-binding protein [Betaproteobacteria bacterium]|nr:MAG: ABC transporter substrate-binding protein [Betaproteobacteria bacterium]
MAVRWLTAFTLALVCFAAYADEVTLRAVSGFNPGTTFSSNFEAFIKRVNERGKGVVQVHYVGGGGKVMDPFQMGNALKTGVVDIANLPGSFYTNVVPEADALKLIPGSVSKLKGSDVYKLLEEAHNKKGQAHLLARQKTLVPFHLYVNKKIAGMDLSDLKLRTTPIYAPFFTAMGATVVRLAPGDIYTALERGVVDGYGWPLQGVFDLGWQEVTKFRVDPGFYNAADEILVNLTKWNGLAGPQRAILEEAGAWMERSGDADDLEINRKEDERQRKQGIQIITLIGEQRDKYLKLADETAWQAVIKAAPEYGPKLKQALSKQ